MVLKDDYNECKIKKKIQTKNMLEIKAIKINELGDFSNKIVLFLNEAVNLTLDNISREIQSLLITA